MEKCRDPYKIYIAYFLNSKACSSSLRIFTVHYFYGLGKPKKCLKKISEPSKSYIRNFLFFKMSGGSRNFERPILLNF